MDTQITTLDDLANFIAHSDEPDPATKKLSEYLIGWKLDGTNVEDLKASVERYLGNTWITKKEVHNKIYKAWSEFSELNISRIGGMTMNERLYAFSLFEMFDKATETKDSSKTEEIYKKLMAQK